MTNKQYESKSQMKRVEILKAEEKQMTHEELLQELADIAHNKDAHEARNDYLLALRAVVELHKPALTDYPSYCLHCETYGSIVPCPTIQAIEKELK